MNDSMTSKEKDVLGVVIADKYRVDKMIARGGFSAVYRGTQMGMGRPVAIKILDLGDEIEATWMERFGREARLVSQLRHPNTITIFDFGKHEDDFLYIVMEYINGRSLSRQIKKHGALDPHDVAFIAGEILKSLDEAHSGGILHRDLKPSNIMIARDHNGIRVVKVLDFGVAKILEPSEVDIQLTAQGAFVGTPRYASPEQLRREEATVASDIYGVGMVMWEALVGDPPVPSTDFSSCVEYHLGPQPWQLPDSVDCPPGLAHILYTALQKDASERYANCRQMLSDLETWYEETEVPGPLQDVFDAISEVEEVSAPIEFIGETSFDSDVIDTEQLDPPELSAQTVTDEPDPLNSSWEPDAEFDPDAVRLPPLPKAAHSARDSIAERNLERARRQASARADLDLSWEDELTREHDQRSDEFEEIAVAPTPSEPRAPDRAERPERRERAATSSRSAAADASSPMLFLALGALALLLIVGVVAYSKFNDGDATQIAGDAEQAAPVDVTADLPLIPTERILAGMRSAGWLTSGQVEESDFGSTKQTSAMMASVKSDKAASVIVYECATDDLARQLIDGTRPPTEVVAFGRTVVKIAPGPSSQPNGVSELTQMLFTYQGMMRDKGML